MSKVTQKSPTLFKSSSLSKTCNSKTRAIPTLWCLFHSACLTHSNLLILAAKLNTIRNAANALSQQGYYINSSWHYGNISTYLSFSCLWRADSNFFYLTIYLTNLSFEILILKRQRRTLGDKYIVGHIILSLVVLNNTAVRKLRIPVRWVL